MNFKDFTVYTWYFAQFALAHEYLLTSLVSQYSGSGGVVSKVLALAHYIFSDINHPNFFAFSADF